MINNILWELNYIESIYVDRNGKIIGECKNGITITLGHIPPIYFIILWDKTHNTIISFLRKNVSLFHIKKVYLKCDFGTTTLHVILDK